MNNDLYKPVRIGGLFLSGNIFLAPVAGYSDRSFRSICKACGADFTYTEMVSSEALVRNSKKTDALIARAENEKAYSVQIFGANPAFMAKAAVIIAEKYSPECIDINSGCPMTKITKTGAGSALMNDIPLLYKIVKAVNDALEPYKIPVTLKIRAGFTNENLNWKEAATAAIDAGIKLITIHPRTRTQVYSGKADWDIIAELVRFTARYRLPVFGSGDLFFPEDAKNMLKTTGCAGVMFARGAMGNPFVFTQTKKLLTEGSYSDISIKERLEIGFKELLLLCIEKGEAQGCREMRKRFAAYTKGMPNGSLLREKLVTASSIREYQIRLQDFSLSLNDPK